MKNRLKILNKKFARAGVSLVVLVFVMTILFVLYRPRSTQAQIFLTSGNSWTVPSDWNSANNSIDAIGGGGGGGGGFQLSAQTGGNAGGGGGGGGFGQVLNVKLTPGTLMTYSVGAAGGGGASSTDGTAGGDTYMCKQGLACSGATGTGTLVGGPGGGQGFAGTSLNVGGGGSAGGVGTGNTTNTGGGGGNGGAIGASTGAGGGGGGGAGGPSGGGNSGVSSTNTSGANGGQGDGIAGGSGGLGGATGGGSNGGSGTEYDISHGSGGGGGGGAGAKAAAGFNGGNGGVYGSGGGGGGGNGKSNAGGGSGGNGMQGLIRITYTKVTQSNFRWRLDDGAENAGTSLAAQDSPATVTGTTPVRLRFLVKDDGESTSYNYRLEYAPYANGCYSWTAVPVTATTEAFNMYNTSNYTNNTASTNVTSGSGVINDPAGYTFTAGSLMSTSNTASVALTGGQFTEIEYSFQANANATLPKYCFRLTNAGVGLDSYNNYPILNINYTPSAPTIYSVTGGSNISRLPVYQLRSSDLNDDYLQYQVELCLANSWPCTSGAMTYTTSDSCWSGQNANSDTAYSSGTVERDSQMAVCTTPVDSTHILAPNTTYYMRAKASDPGGSNTYSAYSSVISFTTGNLDIQIMGGTNINGGTKIGN